MRYWHLLGILGAALVAQTTLAGFLKIGGVAPNILLAVVVTFGLLFGPQAGGAAGALAGLFRDVAFGRFIGLSVLSLGVVGLLAGLLEQRVFKENPLLPVTAGFIATLLAEAIHLAVLHFFRPDLVQMIPLEKTLLPSALYTMVVTALIYGRVLRSYNFLRPDPRATIRTLQRR